VPASALNSGGQVTMAARAGSASWRIDAASRPASMAPRSRLAASSAAPIAAVRSRAARSGASKVSAGMLIWVQ
jgi:hypothetical protein